MSESFDPPRKLSIWLSHPAYHPSYPRVGVKLNGVERNDVQWYDLDKQQLRIKDTNELLEGDIVAFWRYPETRQQRRARESWEKKRNVRINMGSGSSGADRSKSEG